MATIVGFFVLKIVTVYSTLTLIFATITNHIGFGVKASSHLCITAANSCTKLVSKAYNERSVALICTENFPAVVEQYYTEAEHSILTLLSLAHSLIVHIVGLLLWICGTTPWP